MITSASWIGDTPDPLSDLCWVEVGSPIWPATSCPIILRGRLTSDVHQKINDVRAGRIGMERDFPTAKMAAAAEEPALLRQEGVEMARLAEKFVREPEQLVVGP